MLSQERNFITIHIRDTLPPSRTQTHHMLVMCAGWIWGKGNYIDDDTNTDKVLYVSFKYDPLRTIPKSETIKVNHCEEK